MNRFVAYRPRVGILKVLLAVWLVAILQPLQAREYQSHSYQDKVLTVTTDDGRLMLSFRNQNSLDVIFEPEGQTNMRAFLIDGRNQPIDGKVKNKKKELRFSAEGLSAVIRKSPLSIEYYRGKKLVLAEEEGFFVGDEDRGVRFRLTPGEKLLGGGERSLEADRRGYRLPLYNAPHGLYTTHSEQMNYGLPGVLSSNKYMVMFDNSARGWIDFGRTDPDVLSFEAVGGRLSYLVVVGDTYPEIVTSYVDVTGTQPMPPRWALGYIASRFGYHSEQEARDTLAKFAEEGFPVDAIIFDLYWFGPEIQGSMGNLDWYREAFPNPEKMIADFQQQGIETVLITEPFILTQSGKWEEAVAEKVLATDGEGNPFTWKEFYFGETGIIDIFDAKAKDWFWGIYRGLMEQGVAGWWCDLAEPEQHPAGAMHVIGSADEVHNAYGHEWAAMIYDNQTREYPDRRPFILMRSGFAGSQRYGLIPWTGDVARAWGGLKPQVGMSLQMGLMGLAYTHSDLGGFAGEVFIKDMYIRWLQYGVFQPIYRPHGIEPVAPEPVFHDDEVKEIIGRYVNLRYRLMPYLYTLAHENSTTGMPLMRPLFFSDESKPELMDNQETYFWGDAFLVAPITDPAVNQKRINLPQGVWFDFWNEQKYEGGRTQTLPVTLNDIPVLVKAGSFIPMVEQVNNSASYSSAELALHYYHDDSVREASGRMYEDDGKTLGAYDRGMYELLQFEAEAGKSGLEIHLQRAVGESGYEGMPAQRRLRLVVHNGWQAAAISVGDAEAVMVENAADLGKHPVAAWFDAASGQLQVSFDWSHQPVTVSLARN